MDESLAVADERLLRAVGEIDSAAAELAGRASPSDGDDLRLARVLVERVRRRVVRESRQPVAA